jgi:hypothetical protein
MGKIDKMVGGHRDRVAALLRFLVSPCRFSLVWVPWVICVSGFVLHICLFYPGVLLPDAYSQLWQIETGVISDWHPPIMAATWRWMREAHITMTGSPTTGAGMIYLFFTALVWSGLLLILRSGKSFWNNKGTAQKTWLLVVLSIIFLLWSFLDIFDDLRNIIKDAGLLGSFLFAVGCLLNYPSKKIPRFFVVCLVLVCLFYGTALRHNAVFAVLPLLFWLVWAVVPSCRKFYFIVPIGIIVWGIMLSTINYVNYQVIGALHVYPLQERFYNDIFHLNARTSRYVIPPNTFGINFDSLDETTFRRYFNKNELFLGDAFRTINTKLADTNRIRVGKSMVTSIDKQVSPDKQGYIQILLEKSGADSELYLPNEQMVVEQYPKDYITLRDAWIQRVLMDPAAYIKFKTRVFVKYCKNTTLYFAGINAGHLLPLMFCSIILLTLLSKNRTSPAVFPCLMLGWSALLYILPLWMFLPSTEPRYLQWFFAASFISIVLFLAHSPLFAEIMQTVQRHFKRRG